MKRDDILNATAKSFESIKEYLDNLEINKLKAAAVREADPDK